MPWLAAAAAAALILTVALVGAEYSGQQQQQQQLNTDTYANGGGDDQQQAATPKAKKIQIVYIKVPLAKLKPSLANNGGDYGASASTAENSTYAGQHDSSK